VFLTVLAPSERSAQHHRRRHKTLTDRAQQALLQVARCLPDRRIIAVADSSYAAIDLLNAVRHRLCVVARRRLDARRFDRRHGAGRGRPRRRSPFTEPVGAAGEPPHALAPPAGDRLIWPNRAPGRDREVRDGTDEVRPPAVLCTDMKADPLDIRRWFVRRWCTEVTFEVRRHRGVETQCQ
jgi:hypothetical protein